MKYDKCHTQTDPFITLFHSYEQKRKHKSSNNNNSSPKAFDGDSLVILFVLVYSVISPENGAKKKGEFVYVINLIASVSNASLTESGD